MNIDHLKLSIKSLIPIAMMAVTVLAMVGLGASRIENLGSTASEIIKKRDAGEVSLARAGRRMVYMPYDVLAMVSYDNVDAGGKAAIEDFERVVAETNSLMDEAASLMPDRAAAIASFKGKFDDLYEKAKVVFERASATPGVVRGRDLKPDELQAMAEAAKGAIEIDLGTRELVKQLRAFGDELLRENAAAAEALEVDGRRAVWTLAIIGIVSTLGAGGFSLWLSGAKIARPLKRMVGRMQALAGGDLSVEIGDDGRRDEIGDIARAVQVFKANAVERERIEREASGHRAAIEAERERTRVERERDAEELATALRALGQGLSRIAEGDLTARLDDGFSERYAQMRGDFNGATEKLLRTLRSVIDATGAIRAGTQQITGASDDLSHRTEQQAANLEETAAALTQITETVRQSAEGAKHAREIVEAANFDAMDGAIVVKQAKEAMDAISASSSQIGNIIGAIDEIAFQTNLLALNAGVEAARAGESGRGFAVVASEVRALAQRSAEAAKEIKTLVSCSATTVESGVELVAKTGAALERIIGQVSQINAVVTQIATGAAEQANAIREVNEAITNMDRATQQNATMVEESTAASHSLGRETSQLAQLVEQFNVGATASSPSETKPNRPAGFASAPSIPSVRPPRREAGVASGARRPAKRAVGGEGWSEF